MIEKLPSTNMDNFKVDVTAKGKEILQHVIELLMSDYHQVIAYMEDDSPGNRGARRLHLYWYYDQNDNATKLLYPFNLEQCVEFVWGWLLNAELGSEPDIDGSCSKGWRIHNVKGGWSHVTFVVEPVWAQHHK